MLMDRFVREHGRSLMLMPGNIRWSQSTKVFSSAPAKRNGPARLIFSHNCHTSFFINGLLPCRLSGCHGRMKFGYRGENRYFSSGDNGGFKKSTARKTDIFDERTDDSSSTSETETDDPIKSDQMSHAESIMTQLRSIPNLITLTRIASTPLISYFIITEQYDIAVTGCILAGFTDWLDGEIARRYNMCTVLGTYLDPIADKVMVNMLSVSLWYQSILPGPIVVLWLARDAALVVATYRAVSLITKEGEAVTDPSRTPLKVEPTMISKVNTLLQFATLGTGMIQPLSGIPPSAILGLCWVTAGTTIASALSYYDGGSLTKSGNIQMKDNQNDNNKSDEERKV